MALIGKSDFFRAEKLVGCIFKNIFEALIEKIFLIVKSYEFFLNLFFNWIILKNFHITFLIESSLLLPGTAINDTCSFYTFCVTKCLFPLVIQGDQGGLYVINSF